MNVQRSLLALTIAAAAALTASGQKEDSAAASQAASAADMAASSVEMAGSAAVTAASAAVDSAASAVDNAAAATAAAAASAVDAASAAAGAASAAVTGAAAGAAAGLDLAKGEALYKSTCQACHAAGVAGAPKLDDKADWAPRIAQGEETLFKHSIEGFTGQKGVMPPKGGSTAPDEDVKAAVMYMVSHAK